MSRCDVCGSLGKVHEIMKHKVHDLSERVAKLEARTNAAWGPIEPFELAMSVPSGRACAACLRTLSGNGCCPNRCAQPSAKGLGSAPLASGQLASAGEARQACRPFCRFGACPTPAECKADEEQAVRDEPPAEQPSRQETGVGETECDFRCGKLEGFAPTATGAWDDWLWYCTPACRDRAKAKAAEQARRDNLNDCHGTSGEAPKVEDRRADDPCEANQRSRRAGEEAGTRPAAVDHRESKAGRPGEAAQISASPSASRTIAFEQPAEPSGAGQVARAPVGFRVGDAKHVALWDAVNDYAEACGGKMASVSVARMNAVARVEKAVRDILEPIAEPPAPAVGTLSERLRSYSGAAALPHWQTEIATLADEVAAIETRLAQAELFLAVKDKVVAGFEERCKEADKKLAQAEQQSACAKPMAGGRVVCGINGALCNDCWRRLTPVIGVQEQVDAVSGPLEFWENEAKEWAAAHDEQVAKLAQAERDKASATQSLVDEYDRRKKAERERDAAAEEGRKRHLAAVLRAEEAEKLVEKAHARESELAARAREATARERARCLAWVKLGYSGTRESLQAVDSIRSGAPASGTGEPNCRDATAGKVEP